MAREIFIELFNEKPEEILGMNWLVLIDDYLKFKYEEKIRGLYESI